MQRFPSRGPHAEVTMQRSPYRGPCRVDHAEVCMPRAPCRGPCIGDVLRPHGSDIPVPSAVT
eukprot:213306-Chlamydomonas_euryale.AAC.1